MKQLEETRKITRGISNAFAKAFVTSELFTLYKATLQGNRKDLFLGIRNDYISIYYNGASVCKVEYDEKRRIFSCETAKNICMVNAEKKEPKR